MTGPRIGVVVHTKRRDDIFLQRDIDRLNELGEATWTDEAEPLDAEQAIELLQGCEIGVGTWGSPHPDAELLAACGDLKLWVHAAGSVKGMFGPHLEGRDLKIVSCKYAIGLNVADAAVAELVLGLRKILINAADNRRGRASGPPGRKFIGTSTIGVVGASDVGRRTIELLRAMDCGEILLYDPYVDAAEAARLGAAKVTDVTELCRRSDAVTLHTPALEATRHIIGPEQLAAMGDDCVIVNTARGMCIDEAALTAELAKGRLFAFLDVTDPEPAAGDSPLRRLPNVVLTSHIAGGPAPNIGTQVVDDIRRYLDGERPVGLVTADMLDRLA
jgi:phosphoglycerate dehydrogenase-like enzyme